MTRESMRCHLEWRRAETVDIFCEAATEIRAVQFEKQSSPTETAGDRMSFVRAEQFLKAQFPIVVTESGMVMAAREEQTVKANSLISVTPSGMVIAAREEHDLKALMPIDVTESGIVMAARAVHP